MAHEGADARRARVLHADAQAQVRVGVREARGPRGAAHPGLLRHH